MSYEAWRSSYQSSEQAARSAYREWVKCKEKDSEWQKYVNAFVGVAALNELRRRFEEEQNAAH